MAIVFAPKYWTTTLSSTARFYMKANFSNTLCLYVIYMYTSSIPLPPVDNPIAVKNIIIIINIIII